MRWRQKLDISKHQEKKRQDTQVSSNVNSSTSFLHNQSPHVPPAQVKGHLATETLQQVLSSILQVESSLVLQGESIIPHSFNLSFLLIYYLFVWI